jgi:hypothetical protein
MKSWRKVLTDGVMRMRMMGLVALWKTRTRTMKMTMKMTIRQDFICTGAYLIWSMVTQSIDHANCVQT